VKFEATMCFFLFRVHRLIILGIQERYRLQVLCLIRVSSVHADSCVESISFYFKGLGALLVTVVSLSRLLFFVLDNFLGYGVPFFAGVTLPLPFAYCATILTERSFYFRHYFFCVKLFMLSYLSNIMSFVKLPIFLVEMLVGIY
jgi:hypothetical protein